MYYKSMIIIAFYGLLCTADLYIWTTIIVIFALIEDYEELKAKFADNEVYITELLEGKLQAEEQKQIITG